MMATVMIVSYCLMAGKLLLNDRKQLAGDVLLLFCWGISSMNGMNRILWILRFFTGLSRTGG